MHQQISRKIKDKKPHTGGGTDSHPSNLNPSNNPGSQTSSINREKKGEGAEDPPARGGRAELREEGEGARSGEGVLCCTRPGIKHKNLSNDVHQQKKE